jgi:hypothetical protein
MIRIYYKEFNVTHNANKYKIISQLVKSGAEYKALISVYSGENVNKFERPIERNEFKTINYLEYLK